MSLKSRLVEQIKAKSGEIFSYQELINFCRIWGYKVSNAERRLRESCAGPDAEIEAVFHKGYIVGYREKKRQMSLF